MVRIVIGDRSWRVRFVPGRHVVKRGRIVESADVVITETDVLIGARRGTARGCECMSRAFNELCRYCLPVHA
jgi:hypothetical protein